MSTSWRYNAQDFRRRLHEGQGKMVLKRFIQESPSNHSTSLSKKIYAISDFKSPTFCNTNFKYALIDK